MKYKDIKSNLFAIDYEDDDEDAWRGMQTTMKIIRNEELESEHWDGGEPEDNTFGRDWSWVEGAIKRAYVWGVEDAKKGYYDE